jgi:hypothetical protein
MNDLSLRMKLMLPPFSMSPRRAQVAAFLVEAGAVTTAELIERIWGGRRDDQINNLVKVTIHLVRRDLKAALGFDPILSRRGSQIYAIEPLNVTRIKRLAFGAQSGDDSE